MKTCVVRIGLTSGSTYELMMGYSKQTESILAFGHRLNKPETFNRPQIDELSGELKNNHDNRPQHPFLKST